MNRRLLWQTVTAVMVFAIWTSVVRIGISEGNRDSVWFIRPFGDWPAHVHHVNGTNDLTLSIFATFAASDATTAAGGGFPDLVGHPVIGPVVDSGDSEIINGARFTTGIRAGALSSISVFVASPVDRSPHDQFQLAIYEDSSGAPVYRLATTASGTIVPDAWNTLAIRAVLEPRTSYWLMYNTNGTNAAVNNTTFTRVEANPLDSAIRSHGRILSRVGDRIAGFADMTPMVVAIILIGLLAARRRPRAGIVLVLGFFAALFIAWGVRELFFEPYGAYPSGHSLRATYVAVAFGFVVTARLARVAAGSFVALIALAAVYTGGHYSEEVIGGVLLGWAIATAAKAFAGDLTPAPAHAALDVEALKPSIDSSTVVDITDGVASESRSEAVPPGPSV